MTTGTLSDDIRGRKDIDNNGIKNTTTEIETAEKLSQCKNHQVTARLPKMVFLKWCGAPVESLSHFKTSILN
jgi:hypothetical protein